MTMTIDTTTPEGLRKRLYELVDEYTHNHNFRALARLIGGNPKGDLGDYREEDAGEEPKQSLL
jgi:hypothetical protein